MANSGLDREPELCALGVAELGRRYRTGELSPVEVTESTLQRIERLNPRLNAFITVLRDSALAAARASELQIRAGLDLGPLHGIPVSVKDNIRVQGARTTAASRVLMDAPPDQEDATVVRRLRAAGAVVVGKTNLVEFACADSDLDGPFKDVDNPRKPGHQAGSSSSGSAAAVAAGLSVISLGTDTGGSVRHPASVCGVVGMKATLGLLPIRGVIPVSVHRDNVGPLGRSIRDVAEALAAIAGHDSADPYSVLTSLSDYAGAIGRNVAGLRMGIPTNAFYRFGLPEALDLVEKARGKLAELGLAAMRLELPGVEESNDVADLMTVVDANLYHERHQDRADLYGRHFRERAEWARRVTGLEYAQARLIQAKVRRQWLALFKRVDIVALPANLAPAPRQGEHTIEIDGKPYPFRRVNSRSNRISSLTGFPALTLPIGQLPDGSPVGIQLVGPPFAEARLLAVGHALEQAQGDLVAEWGIDPQKEKERPGGKNG